MLNKETSSKTLSKKISSVATQKHLCLSSWDLTRLRIRRSKYFRYTRKINLGKWRLCSLHSCQVLTSWHSHRHFTLNQKKKQCSLKEAVCRISVKNGHKHTRRDLKRCVCCSTNKVNFLSSHLYLQTRERTKIWGWLILKLTIYAGIQRQLEAYLLHSRINLVQITGRNTMQGMITKQTSKQQKHWLGQSQVL